MATRFQIATGVIPVYKQRAPVKRRSPPDPQAAFLIAKDLNELLVVFFGPSPARVKRFMEQVAVASVGRFPIYREAPFTYKNRIHVIEPGVQMREELMSERVPGGIKTAQIFRTGVSHVDYESLPFEKYALTCGNYRAEPIEALLKKAKRCGSILFVYSGIPMAAAEFSPIKGKKCNMVYVDKRTSKIIR